MASIIAIANLKGGVGKSTLSQNLGISLQKRGRSVCIVDTDTEQKSTLEWGERRANTGHQSLPVYLAREERLAKEVSEFSKKYDFVLVDGSPALSEVATKIMMVSDLVLVPVMPSGNDFGALEKFLVRFDDVRAMLRSRDVDLEIAVVLNGYNDRVIVNKAISEAIKKLEVPVLKTEIAHRAAYQEANLTGAGVLELTDRKAVLEIESLTDEVLTILEG